MQNSSAVSTSARVTIACDHAPIAPMATSEIRVAIPMPTLEIRQAISAKRIIATGAGIPSNSCWKALRI